LASSGQILLVEVILAYKASLFSNFVFTAVSFFNTAEFEHATITRRKDLLPSSPGEGIISAKKTLFK